MNDVATLQRIWKVFRLSRFAGEAAPQARVRDDVGGCSKVALTPALSRGAGEGVRFFYAIDVSQRRTTSATRSGVNPKYSNSAAPGADSPKRSMPITQPSPRTYFHQSALAPASIAIFGTPEGSTDSRYSSG